MLIVSVLCGTLIGALWIFLLTGEALQSIDFVLVAGVTVIGNVGNCLVLVIG